MKLIKNNYFIVSLIKSLGDTMKQLIIFLSVIFLFQYCSDIDNPISEQGNNPFSGYYKIYLTGNLSGSATIIVKNSGLIENGIVCKYFDSLETITYLNSYVDNSGVFNSEFFCDKYFYFINDTIHIKSSTGNFSGSFNADTAKGSFNVSLIDSGNFSGSWYGIKIE